MSICGCFAIKTPIKLRLVSIYIDSQVLEDLDNVHGIKCGINIKSNDRPGVLYCIVCNCSM